MRETDHLLADIDSLIDEQLEEGESNQDSFAGQYYDKCVWCQGSWHFLPITQDLENMRLGSFGRDEFGQGIVDPDYSYKDDTSPVLCPGSETHGVVHWTGIWAKARREKMMLAQIRNRTNRYMPTPLEVAWAEEVSAAEGGDFRADRRDRPPYPGGHTVHGPVWTWRFKPPSFANWDVVFNEENTIAYNPGTERNEVVHSSRSLMLTYREVFVNQDREWIIANQEYIDHLEYANSGNVCIMHPIMMAVETVKPYFTQEGEQYPEYVEIVLPRHENPAAYHWMSEFWECMDALPTYEGDEIPAPIPASPITFGFDGANANNMMAVLQNNETGELSMVPLGNIVGDGPVVIMGGGGGGGSAHAFPGGWEAGQSYSTSASYRQGFETVSAIIDEVAHDEELGIPHELLHPPEGATSAEAFAAYQRGQTVFQGSATYPAEQDQGMEGQAQAGEGDQGDSTAGEVRSDPGVEAGSEE